MLSGLDSLTFLLSKYPPDLQEALRTDIQQLLQRDRSYMCSQLQTLFAGYHCCNALQALGADVDALLDEFTQVRQGIDRVLL